MTGRPPYANPTRERLPEPLEFEWAFPELLTQVACVGCRTDLEAAASTLHTGQRIDRSAEATIRATLNVIACAAAGHPRLLTDSDLP
jgi:hypothetical protein